MELQFDMMIFREGNSYVAYCPELDLSSCGADVDNARRNLKTAVRLFIEETRRLGTLDEVLREAGYVRQGAEAYVPPQLVALESATVATGD